MWQARCEQKKTFLLNLTVLNKQLIGSDGRNHRILNGRSEQSGLRLRAMTIRFTQCWYAGNWKSCNGCRIFSVKAIFETRESRPKLISSTREQNFQKCPALLHTHMIWQRQCIKIKQPLHAACFSGKRAKQLFLIGPSRIFYSRSYHWFTNIT